TPSSRSHVSALSAASVCTNTSRVANPGEIIPAPLACPLNRTVPFGSSTRSAARFSNASVVWIASANARSPSTLSSRPAPAGPRPAQRARCPGDRARAGIPRERHADHAGRGDGDARLVADAAGDRRRALHLGGVLESGPAGCDVRVPRADDDRADPVQPAALE